MVLLLVAAVSFIAKNLTSFLTVASFTEGYILIASTDDIVTLSLFISNYSIISFRFDAWRMDMHE